MIRAAIFDLDGTLLNTLDALTYCTNETLVRMGYGENRITQADTRRIVGDGYRMQMTRALKLVGGDAPERLEEACRIYMEVFSKNCTRNVRPFEGIPELLAKLQGAGIKIACFSNKPDAQAVENIETIFGKGYFDAIRGERQGTPKKPDPAGALRIAETLHVSPDECIYLGDTNTDMQTGANAKMTTIGVLWGYRDREELAAFHPAYLVETPAEVLPIAGIRADAANS